MTENMNLRNDRTEFAPTVVENAVRPENIEKLRTEREINTEIADMARKFNKVIGKISHVDAYEIFENVDFRHFESFNAVYDAVNNAFVNQPEGFYRTDGIVSRLQVVLAERGVKEIDW